MLLERRPSSSSGSRLGNALVVRIEVDEAMLSSKA